MGATLNFEQTLLDPLQQLLSALRVDCFRVKLVESEDILDC